jgi:hypothetical protein
MSRSLEYAEAGRNYRQGEWIDKIGFGCDWGTGPRGRRMVWYRAMDKRLAENCQEVRNDV